MSASASTADVSAKELRVAQDGNPASQQPAVLTDVPLRLGLLLDESGSGRRLPSHDPMLQRALVWVGERLATHKRDAFLVGFNDKIITSTQVTSDPSALQLAFNQLRPIGGSAIWDAVVHASQKFYSVVPTPQPTARVLVLVSDGNDNASYVKEQNSIESAQRTGVRIYVIGLPSDPSGSGKRALEQLATSTGGQAFFPSDMRGLEAALVNIDGDLKRSLLVGFVPNKLDGKSHKLTVDVPSKSHLRCTQVFYAPIAQ